MYDAQKARECNAGKQNSMGDNAVSHVVVTVEILEVGQRK